MNETRWKELLATLQIDTVMGKLKPIKEVDVKRFEDESKIPLPQSYRTFCSVFGAGELALEIRIAAAGYGGKLELWSLSGLQRQSQEGLEFEEYSPDAKQHARSVFFAVDLLGTRYFFDPKDVTNKSGHEYAVYSLSRDWEVRRHAENFWQFVTEFCLGPRHRELFQSDEPLELVFKPVK